MSKKTFFYTLICATAMLYAARASISTPQGGPRDEMPPKMVKASPAPGACGVQTRSMHLEFDEFITLKDAFTNVVVSPTSDTQPRVSGVGKRVNIQFIDSLLPNTTYTIDFGDAIQDNNEGNALQAFSYLFSTGNTVDSLRIAGMVLDSRTLEPQQGIIVGIHTSDADTAFSRIRLERVARTDDCGRFTLRGLAAGRYRLFALADLNGDLRWDNPEERIAFFDQWITPTAQAETVSDTVFNAKTLAVDTVQERYSTLFLPNNILLSCFSLGYRPQYLKSSQRPDSTRAVLVWNAPQSSLPDIRLLSDPSKPISSWAETEIRQGNDSVTLWLRNPELVHNDTLRLQVKYLRNLTRTVTEIATDTLTLICKHRPTTQKKQGKNAAPIVPLLDIKGGAQTQEYPLPYGLSFAAPLDTVYADRIHLQQKADTLWIPVQRNTPLLQRADTLNPLKYIVSGPWEYGTQYRLQLDSLAVTDLYGRHNKPTTLNFSVRKAEDYGNLSFTITGITDTPAFVELLDGSDKVLRTQPVESSVVTFTYLQPATYYARLIFDTNGNGLYDTGDYDRRLQPEAVAYYPKKITLRKNWDQSLTWNVNEVPVDLQKPASIKKNKPKSQRRGKNNRNEQTEPEEEEAFDPNANPFDPNSRRNRNRNNVNPR